MATKKLQILGNIPSVADDVKAVSYDTEQTLTDEQKAQARTNIGAADQTALDEVSSLVGDTSVATQISDAVSQKSQVQIVTSDSSEILPTLKIHKLTQEEYEQELEAGTVDENALYLTPNEEIDLSGYATVESLSTKADVDHNHDDVYYTETEIDTKLSTVNASIDTKASQTDMVALQNLVGETPVSEQISAAVAQKSQVQFITWEADD